MGATAGGEVMGGRPRLAIALIVFVMAMGCSTRARAAEGVDLRRMACIYVPPEPNAAATAEPSLRARILDGIMRRFYPALTVSSPAPSIRGLAREGSDREAFKRNIAHFLKLHHHYAQVCKIRNQPFDADSDLQAKLKPLGLSRRDVDGVGEAPSADILRPERTDEAGLDEAGLELDPAQADADGLARLISSVSAASDRKLRSDVDFHAGEQIVRMDLRKYPPALLDSDKWDWQISRVAFDIWPQDDVYPYPQARMTPARGLALSATWRTSTRVS
jgi:hypothetical protein